MACERCDSIYFDMICETHPWLEWPHDDCAGPGCPPSAAVSILHYRLRQLHLVIRAREATIVELFYALKEKLMDTKELVQDTYEPHAWKPQWNLWHRITTALRASYLSAANTPFLLFLRTHTSNTSRSLAQLS